MKIRLVESMEDFNEKWWYLSFALESREMVELNLMRDCLKYYIDHHEGKHLEISKDDFGLIKKLYEQLSKENMDKLAKKPIKISGGMDKIFS